MAQEDNFFYLVSGINYKLTSHVLRNKMQRLATRLSVSIYVTRETNSLIDADKQELRVLLIAGSCSASPATQVFPQLLVSNVSFGGIFP
jgi:hypothetical protein